MVLSLAKQLWIELRDQRRHTHTTFLDGLMLSCHANVLSMIVLSSAVSASSEGPNGSAEKFPHPTQFKQIWASISGKIAFIIRGF